MKVGVTVPITRSTLQPRELGELAEALGFASLFVPEHTHIPSNRETPYLRGGDLPPEYTQLYSPLVALTQVASATSRLEVGTAVCLLSQHDPISFAKDLATLDVVSSGRLVLGVGAGWNREEMRNHGVDPSQRWSHLGEHIDAVRRIWAEDEAAFEGQHVRFDGLWSWPKPVQKPNPPILIGGAAPRVLPHVVAHADGWLPRQIGSREFDNLEASMQQLAAMAEAADRGPVSVSIVDPLEPPPTPDDLHRYAALGIERCILRLRPAQPRAMVKDLERYGAVVAAAGLAVR